MIFGVALQVFGQLRDPAGEQRDLHIRAAGVLLVQLELLQSIVSRASLPFRNAVL